MNSLNDFQLAILRDVLNAPEESASQLRPAEPGFFYLTHDKWRTVRRIPHSGDERSYYLIQDLVNAGFLRMAAVRQPVPGGFERREFYFMTPLGRAELATIDLEQRVLA
jgi:hypothetical protein